MTKLPMGVAVCLEKQDFEILKLKALLKELEWAGSGAWEGEPYCLSCHADKIEGHTSHCRLDAAIKDKGESR